MANKNHSPAHTNGKSGVRKRMKIHATRSTDLVKHHASAAQNVGRRIFGVGSIVLGAAVMTLVAAGIVIFGPARFAGEFRAPLQRATRTPFALGAGKLAHQIVTEANNILK
jgi:hypothetical protein